MNRTRLQREVVQNNSFFSGTCCKPSKLQIKPFYSNSWQILSLLTTSIETLINYTKNSNNFRILWQVRRNSV